MELPFMAGLQGYQQSPQPRLSTMQRFHSQQLPPQQLPPQHVQRQRSGMTPACSLTSPTGPSSRPSMPSGDLGELFNAGSTGSTAPRMSNAVARSLGLVPPKETRTRTLGTAFALLTAKLGIVAPSDTWTQIDVDAVDVMTATAGPCLCKHSICMHCEKSLLMVQHLTEASSQG